MPNYDFRCGACGRTFDLFYKSFAAYETAQHHCPHCHSTDVTRRIRGVAIPQPARDLARLSSSEMLSVLDSGNSQAVGRMFQQVAESAGGEVGAAYQEATGRLLKGESVERAERAAAEVPPPPPKTPPTG